RRHAGGPRQGPGVRARRCAPRARWRARHLDDGIPVRRRGAPPAGAGDRGRIRPPHAEEIVKVQRASRAAHIPADAVLRRWARAALSREADVTVRYVAETEARRLNREYRGKDYATNVLTFIYETKPLAGDIVICAPVVAAAARARGPRAADRAAALGLRAPPARRRGALHDRGRAAGLRDAGARRDDPALADGHDRRGRESREVHPFRDRQGALALP